MNTEKFLEMFRRITSRLDCEDLRSIKDSFPDTDDMELYKQVVGTYRRGEFLIQCRTCSLWNEGDERCDLDIKGNCKKYRYKNM